jgi:ribonucleotide reductase beta subunit family protein with ferritin-like domain
MAVSKMISLEELAKLMVHSDVSPRTQKLVQHQRDTKWLAQELSFAGDVTSWKALPDRQARIVINLLRFFVLGDSIVNSNILQNLLSSGLLSQWTETFLIDQASQECAHRETYQAMAEWCMAGRDMTMERFLGEMPAEIIEKTRFMLDCVNMNVPLVVRLFLFAALEGVFFAGAFAIFGYFRRTGKLLEIGRANAFISRDETLHCLHAATCYHEHFSHEPLSDQVTTEIISRVVAMEEAFLLVALENEDLDVGLSIELLVRYIRHCGNRVLALFDKPPLYPADVECPIHFMNVEGVSMHSNFFASGAVDYVAAPAAIVWDAVDV